MNILDERHRKIPKETWQAISQKMELDIWKNSDRDKNEWWRDNFNNYACIVNERVDSLLEVGCGPFAKNTEFVMNALKSRPGRILLNDPLLDEYIKLGKPVKEFAENNKAVCYSVPLEECRLQEPVDMIISVNVLDHVYDMDLCLESIYNNLKPGGILILGNSLTSEQNFRETPKIDPYGMLHPIRFDDNDIKSHLEKYGNIFKKISEPDGRHYGTLFYIGKKT